MAATLLGNDISASRILNQNRLRPKASEDLLFHLLRLFYRRLSARRLRPVEPHFENQPVQVIDIVIRVRRPASPSAVKVKRMGANLDLLRFLPSGVGISCFQRRQAEVSSVEN